MDLVGIDFSLYFVRSTSPGGFAYFFSFFLETGDLSGFAAGGRGGKVSLTSLIDGIPCSPSICVDVLPSCLSSVDVAVTSFGKSDCTSVDVVTPSSSCERGDLWRPSNFEHGSEKRFLSPWNILFQKNKNTLVWNANLKPESTL